MPNDTKYFNLFYYILIFSTLYALGYAWFFLESYRVWIFSGLGVVIIAGVLGGRFFLKGKTGASKGYTSIGLMLFYSVIWLGLVIFILVLELEVAMNTLQNYNHYFHSKAGSPLLFVVKVSPLPLLLFNLLSWFLFFPRKTK